MNHPLFPRQPAANAVVRRALRASSQRLVLEQRFMFDGTVADAAHAAQAHDVPPPPVPPAVTVRAAEPVKDNGKKEVVLVDTSVASYKTLEAGVRDGVGIVEFDGSKDGLAQIAQWATTDSGYDAIHIFSHGAQGVVDLGTTHLSESALSADSTRQELAQLGQALNSDGDLLLYGCDVAAGAQGSALIDGLAHATGADVAASTDATGAAAKGGNWTLESHVGKIDTDALRVNDYQDLLTVVSITSSDADYSNYQFTKSVNGITFTFTGDPAAGLGMDTSFFPGPEGLYAYDSNTASGVRLTITVQSGYMFDLSGLDVGSFAGAFTIQYTGADNHTGSVSPAANGSWQTFSGLDSSVRHVVTIVLTANDFTDFQNFDFINVRTIAPVTTVNGASLSSDTSASGVNNADFITSTASQTISGTLSAVLGADEKVEVSFDNGNTWSDATHYAAGLSSWSTDTILSGSNTFEARVTNASGSSTAYTHSYALDTTAPSTTFSNVFLSNDTGDSNTDFITNTASQTVTAVLSSSLSAGDVVKGSLDGGVTWTDITAKVSGTTLTWNGATLNGGTNGLELKVIDSAGNESSVYVKNYSLDTTSPTTTISGIQFSNDSGTFHNDFDTNVAAQTVSGTLSANLQAGETVYVSMNNGTTWTAATATVGLNTWSLAGVTLTASGNMRVKVTDTAGNDGTLRIQAYLYDHTAPTTTFGNLALSNDTGTAGDFVTSQAGQSITATISTSLQAGDVLYGSLDGGFTWTDITANVSAVTLTWTGVVLTGNDTLQLKVVDAAGNESAVRSQAYILDTAAPAAPSTPALSGASDAGQSASDLVTNDNTPTLTGTAESGSTVRIYDGATLLGSVVATGGTWSYTSTTLSDNVHTISATATDLAGNVSTASGAIVVTVDTGAPSVTSVAVPGNGTYYTGDPMDFTVNFDEAVYVDTSGGVPHLALTIGATTRFATYVSGSGTSALVFRYTVVNGDSDSDGVSVGALSDNGGTLSDLAGNASSIILNSVGSTAAVLADGSLSGIINVSAVDADGAYGAGSTINITVSFSGTVDVDISSGVPRLLLSSGGSATYAGGSGTSTLTFVYIVSPGENTADLDYSSTSALVLDGATIVDAGNQHNAAVALMAPGTAGSLGANKNLVIDTIAPTITGDLAAFPTDSGFSTSDLITNTASQLGIHGTLTGSLSSGEKVQVSMDDGATWITATAAGTNWNIGPVTLNGSNTMQVRVADAAGNTGIAASYAYVLDTAAPTTTFSDVAFSIDTGISSTDLITNSSAQTISATLSAPLDSGAHMFASIDGGTTWTDVTGKVSGITLSWDNVTLAGSNSLQLRVADAAGNYGAISSYNYTLDTTAPTVSVTGIAFSDDSGMSNGDFITNIAAQTVSGNLSANVAAGETVFVSVDNGTTWHAATTTVGLNTWSVSGLTLVSSDVLKVKVSDAAGNDAPVLSQGYTYDTTSPVVPTVDALSTTSLTPILTGTATVDAGDQVTVTVGGASYSVVSIAGHWRLDLSVAVPDSGTLQLVLNNRYSVVVTVTDVAGNVITDSTANELTVGVIAPPPPVVTAPPVDTPLPVPPPLPAQTQMPHDVPSAIGTTAPQQEAPRDVVVTDINPPPAQPVAVMVLTPDVTALDSMTLAASVLPVERAVFADSTDALAVNVPIPDLALQSGGRFSYQIAADAFTYSGTTADLMLSATQSDGAPLPGWIKFDPRTGRFQGTPPLGFEGTLSFTVVARDARGHTVVQTFKVVVSKDGKSAKSAGLGHDLTGPSGRASLGEQLHAAPGKGAARLAMMARSRA